MGDDRKERVENVGKEA
jgi:hypothetical protein